MRKHLENALTAIAIIGITGFFIWQNHQRGISTSPSYEGSDTTISRPIKDSQALSCQVAKVSDGDTITVDCDREKLKIRFCGIDAPEQSQPLGAESTKLMNELVTQDNGEILVYPIEEDRYGRTVAEVEVFTGQVTDKGERVNLFVNGEMVKQGLAYHYKQYSGNCLNKDAIVYAEADAQKQKVGVWDGNYEKPWDYRKQQRSLSQ